MVHIRFQTKLLLYPFILLLALPSIFSSCEKDEGIDFGGNFTKAETILDYSYGKDEKQKMDIYLPADRNQNRTKFLILLHGGAWLSGDKNEFPEIIPYLQQSFGSDYAVVNMNYRLVKPILGVQYMLPTQTDDIGDVIDFLDENSKNLGVAPQFVLMGESAGGHLSMLYAYKFDDRKRVKAVVNIVGPTDLSDPFYTTDPFYNQGLRLIMNPKKVPDGMTAAGYASPVTWVSASSPPTISFYGNRDHLIPNNQSEELEAKLKQYNVSYRMHVYDGGHDIAEKHAEGIVLKARLFLVQVR